MRSVECASYTILFNGLLDIDNGPLDIDNGLLDIDNGPLDIDNGLLDIDNGPLDIDTDIKPQKYVFFPLPGYFKDTKPVTPVNCSVGSERYLFT